MNDAQGDVVQRRPTSERWPDGALDPGGRVQRVPNPEAGQPSRRPGAHPQGVEGKGGASGGQTVLGGGSKADRKKAVS
jgi:hypothetical protein